MALGNVKREREHRDPDVPGHGVPDDEDPRRVEATFTPASLTSVPRRTEFGISAISSTCATSCSDSASQEPWEPGARPCR
jgi:hypothetical protein